LARSFYEFVARRRSEIINARLLAYVRQLEQARVLFLALLPVTMPVAPCRDAAAACAQLKRELEDGCAREAEAQARVLAEEARCVLVLLFSTKLPALRLPADALLLPLVRSSKQKDQFVAMVSHEARAVATTVALLCMAFHAAVHHTLRRSARR
jgi:hypothetical protein